MKKKSYTDSIKEHQDKQYLPGQYTNGRIHPAFSARTKTGGYLFLIEGILLFFFFSIQILSNISLESLLLLIPLLFAILLIFAGITILKSN